MNFGEVSPERALYKRINFGKKEKVISIRSNKLTYYSEICRHCNNQGTQPYDDAWTLLSKYFYENLDLLKMHKSFNPNDVFQSNSDEMMKNVHLYFCKIIGCYLKDANLNTSPKVKYKFQKISKSLIRRKPSPLIFLNFGYNPYISENETHFLMNNINLVWNKKSHKAMKASTFLSIGRIVVGMAYWDTGKYIKDWWNPVISHRKIKFNDLSEHIPDKA